jgi:GNAT superfamily N-acetyltransferase
VAVRDATEDDLGEICLLVGELADYEHLGHEVELDPDEVRAHLFGPAPVARVLIAEPPDSPGLTAGFALWFPTFSTFLGRPGIWLEDLFVRPEHRGRGLGRELLETLRAATTGRLEWSVLDWNEPSIAFYRSLGARPLDGWTHLRWTLPSQPG